MLPMDNRRLMAELLRRVVAKTPRLNSRVSVLSSHFRSKKSIFRSMKSDRRNVLRCCRLQDGNFMALTTWPTAR